MALTAELIRQNLVAFGEKWSLYQGSERAEAQTFLNELFACYGQDRRRSVLVSRRRSRASSSIFSGLAYAS